MKDESINKRFIDLSPYMAQRNILFLLFNFVTLMIYYGPLKSLNSLSVYGQTLSYLLLVPLMSGYIVYTERDVIFSTKKYSVASGGFFILAGIIFYKLGNVYETALNENDYPPCVRIDVAINN